VRRGDVGARRRGDVGAQRRGDVGAQQRCARTGSGGHGGATRAQQRCARAAGAMAGRRRGAAALRPYWQRGVMEREGMRQEGMR
jgi:hypothetical protein